MIFLNKKNIKIKRSNKKLNNKKFRSVKLIAKVGYFNRLKLFFIIKIFNVFYFKLLIFIIISSLISKKNSLLSLVLINKLKE